MEHTDKNAYKIELSRDYAIPATFSVANLCPYYKEDVEQLDLDPKPPPTRGEYVGAFI